MSRTEDKYPSRLKKAIRNLDKTARRTWPNPVKYVDIYARADDCIQIAAEVLNEHDGSIPLARYRETSANTRGQ